MLLGAVSEVEDFREELDEELVDSETRQDAGRRTGRPYDCFARRRKRSMREELVAMVDPESLSASRC